MKEEVEKLIEKAEHALKVAETLMRDGYPPDAASKIYYSMFYGNSEDITLNPLITNPQYQTP